MIKSQLKRKLLTSSSEQDTPHKEAGKSHMKVRLTHCSSCFLARNMSSKCQILTKPPQKATIKPRTTNSSSSNTCIIITTISQTTSHYTPQHESIHQLSCSDLPYHMKKGDKRLKHPRKLKMASQSTSTTTLSTFIHYQSHIHERKFRTQNSDQSLRQGKQHSLSRQFCGSAELCTDLSDVLS